MLDLFLMCCVLTVAHRETNAQTAAALRQERVVLFLHLLGTDTIGHSSKPHSAPYRDNLRAVDRGIQRTVELLEHFFADNATACMCLLCSVCVHARWTACH